MNYSDYLNKVSQRYTRTDEIQINSLEVKSMYEEIFQMKWLATKLKIFSFISYTNKIDASDIVIYSYACVDYSLKNYKGLPRGIQNGISTFNVLVSENVSKEAIKFATARPKKHFALFEMPIIFDLTNEKIYYYNNTPIWGFMYYKYFRKYIETHFNV